MIRKEAEKASQLSSSATSQAAPPGGDGLLPHVLEDSLHRFLVKEGYNASDPQVLNGAKQRLRELVQARPSEHETVQARPSDRELVQSCLSWPEPVQDRPSEHELTCSSKSEGVQSCPDEHAGHVSEPDGDFIYLYDKSIIYKGGAPVPGRPSAVDRLSLYRHKSDKKFRPIPPLHCVLRMDDQHDVRAAELEKLLQLVESPPSESDFSKTRRHERKKQGRHNDESSVEEKEEEEEMDVDEMEVEPAQDDRKRGRPSGDQLADVKAFEQHIHLEAGALAKKWGVSVDVIFNQAGFGGVAIKKAESLWNTFQKVGSVTIPANMDRMLLLL